MKKILLRTLTVLAIVVPAAAAWMWHSVNTVELQRLGDDVAAITGMGGNVAVLKTSVGPVVVDTMTFKSQGEKIREKVEEFGGAKAVAIINTHYHLDHTHGNPAFALTTPVVSTVRTRRHLLERDAEYWEGDAASLLPSTTFEGEQLLEIGDKRIRCIWLGRGHTDGDLVVLFEKERVLHTGDLFFHDRFPNIDLEAGGSIKEWIGTIDRVLALDFDRIIPGHGEVSDKEGLRRFQAFLRELWAVGETAAREHKTLAQTLNDATLETEATMQPIVVPFVLRLDHDFVVKRAWEEATGAVVYTAPAPPPVPITSPQNAGRG
ncbi:MAG: MBL fold metallo-hydrolase [Deltaproteobacteria bacterium]|nr:MBL fold metallo-hydrolase [Deltaproteobacteria bacterium]